MYVYSCPVYRFYFNKKSDFGIPKYLVKSLQRLFVNERKKRETEGTALKITWRDSIQYMDISINMYYYQNRNALRNHHHESIGYAVTSLVRDGGSATN